MIPMPNIRQIGAIIGLACLAALAIFAWRADSLRAQHLETLRNVRIEYAAFQKDVTAKSATALSKALIAKQQKEAEYAQAATQADASYDALRARYADSLRASAASRGGSGAGPTTQSGDPRVPATSTDPAEFRITQADALICSDLGAYATAAFEWANSLDK